ncbi:MAG: hypothetical protein HY320_15950 [Armatimonadetes bacterium]|nr:hypothetical protein [Armatimonadota bacterium]
MPVEQRWEYERTVDGNEAEGQKCRFCQQLITREAHAAFWTRKAVEDNPDVDYPVEHAYAHLECSEREQAARRKGPLRLPEVPDLPHRHR